MLHDFKAVVGKTIGLDLLFEVLYIDFDFEEIAEAFRFGVAVIVDSLPADGRVVEIA